MSEQSFTNESISLYRKAIELNPNSFELHQKLGEAFHLLGNLTAALASYRRALELAPDEASIHYKLWEILVGDTFALPDKWGKAAQFYRQLLEANRNSSWTYHYLAAALSISEQWEEAAAAAQQAIALNGGYLWTHLILSHALTSRQQWSEVVACYCKTLTVFPDSAEIHSNLWEAFCQLQNWEEATNRYRQLLEQNPNSCWSYYYLGRTLTQLRKWEEALASYRYALELVPEEASIHYKLWETLVGDTFDLPDKWDKAAQHYRQLLQSHPHSFWICHYLAAILCQSQQWEAAAAAAQQAIALNGGYLWTHLILSHALANQEQWEEVVACCGQTLMWFPNLKEIHDQMLEALCKSKNWEETAILYYQLLEKNPNACWVHYYLGRVLTHLEEWEEALAFYYSALKLAPDEANIHYQLWETLVRCPILPDKWDEAMQHYRQLYEANPNSFWICHYLASILCQNKQWEEVVPVAKQGLTINWEYTWSYLILWEAFCKLEKWDEAREWCYQFLEQKPHLHWSHFCLGVVQSHFQQWEEALASYYRALELEPDEANIHRQLWITLFEAQEWDKAVGCYNRILESHPKSLYTNYYLGAIQAHLQRWEEALASYQRTKDFYPISFAKNGSLGFSQLHLQLWNEALTSYVATLAMTPGSFEADRCLWAAIQKLPTWENLLEWYSYMLKFGPYSAKVHQQIDILLASVKQWSVAKNSWQSKKGNFNFDSKNPLVRFSVVQLAECQEAIVACQIALESNMTLPARFDPEIEALHLQVFQVKAETWVSQNFKKARVLKEVALSFCQQYELPEPHLQHYIDLANVIYQESDYIQLMLILKKYVEVQRELSRLHQVDKLGIRFLKEGWSFVLGHTACLDFYVKMCILGWLPEGNCPVLFALSNRIANPSYWSYWCRYLPAISEPSEIETLSTLSHYLDENICITVFADGKALDCIRAAAFVQKEWEKLRYPPLLKLDAAQAEAGWRCLQEEFGIPHDAWFVGLHVRENLHHHSARNANIETYYLAIESIVARGGWVIRMGDPTMKPLPPMAHAIDYAHSKHRSDWMDVFLWASCRFFIGTISGPAQVPPTFGIPCVLTNWMLGYRPWTGQDLFIPKLYWLSSENRYLTFTEAIASAAAYCEPLERFDSLDLKLVDNTPEEINDLVEEMLERLDGTAEYTKDDEFLQKQFNSLTVTHQYLDSNCQPGRAFLHKYVKLLPGGDNPQKKSLNEFVTLPCMRNHD